MKLTEISGLMYIKDENCKYFEKEFEALMKKYSIEDVSEASYNIKFRNSYDLNSKYKPGQIYRITVSKLEMYLVILSIINKSITAVMLSKDRLDKLKSLSIIKNKNDYIIFIKPGITKLKLSNNDELLYNMVDHNTIIKEDNYQPIDQYLQYQEDLKIPIIQSNLY